MILGGKNKGSSGDGFDCKGTFPLPWFWCPKEPFFRFLLKKERFLWNDESENNDRKGSCKKGMFPLQKRKGSCKKGMFPLQKRNGSCKKGMIPLQKRNGSCNFYLFFIFFKGTFPWNSEKFEEPFLGILKKLRNLSLEFLKFWGTFPWNS